MGLKEESKALVSDLIGPLNAQKLDNFDESNPSEFLDKTKEIIANLLGLSIAESKLSALYGKYAN
jgi:hypothetical protein